MNKMKWKQKENKKLGKEKRKSERKEAKGVHVD